MIPNAYFEQGMSSWQIETGGGGIITSPTPFGGTKTFANVANQSLWLTSTKMLPVNPHHTYEVRGSFHRINLDGTTGTIYLAVRLFDEGMNNIAGDGNWWYYPASGVTLTDTTWHTYSGRFGSGTAKPIPADARYMTVGAILNYAGAVPGNRSFELAGLGIFPAGRPPIYTTDSRTGCPPAGATTSTVLISQALDLDRPAYVHVNSSIISLATGRRDSRLVVDGTSVNSWLIRTEVRDWTPHNHSWVGRLEAGSHTIQLVAGTALAAPDGYGCGGTWGYIATSFLE